MVRVTTLPAAFANQIFDIGRWISGFYSPMEMNLFRLLLFMSLVCIACSNQHAYGEEAPSSLPRCEAVPLGNGAVSLRIDGREIVRWNSGQEEVGRKAHFFPVKSPNGADLTRMGHPGAPNHDHHRSLWWAHHDVDGENFWLEGKEASIVQKQWLAYSDGDQARMAVTLGWNQGDRELMEQELVAEVSPAPGGGALLEIQTTFRPSADEVALGKTNFGFLGIRMAKSISNHFGGGEIKDSEGRVGEKAIFGKQARWMDYSGSVWVGEGPSRKAAIGGVTWFDHPDNPRYPTHWHVRSDGWMGASFCFAEPTVIKKGEVLSLRYLFHLRDSAYDKTRAEEIAQSFGAAKGLNVEKSRKPHLAYEIHRLVK